MYTIFLVISILVKKTGFLFRWLSIIKISPTSFQGTPLPCAKIGRGRSNTVNELAVDKTCLLPRLDITVINSYTGTRVPQINIHSGAFDILGLI